MIKSLFLIVSRFYLSKLNKSAKIRDFLMWPIASRVFKGKFNDIVKFKNGILMKTELDDILGRFIIFYGPYLDYFWEPKTIRLMKLLIAETDDAIIAGSHIGYTVLLARNFMQKRDSVIHTFEPVEYLYKISKENFHLNEGLGKIILNRYALSDKDGYALISINNIKSKIVDKNSGVATEKIETITIESYTKRNNVKNIDFMLLDVEGYEFNVFQGMKNIFNDGDGPKDIIFEMSPKIKHGADDLYNIQKYLSGYGYDLYIINDNYELNNIKKEDKDDPVAIFELNKNISLFVNKNYFNVLATKRSKEVIKQFDDIIIK